VSNYFLDSSALVKRYIPEIGSAWIQGIILPATNNIFIASITRSEVVSAVMRRSRESSISSRTAKAVRLLMDRHSVRQYTIIALTDGVVKRSEDLLEAYPLRAYDSIQLASALELNQKLITNGLSALVFLSADNRLLSIATSVGLVTDDPNLHP
jgi:predicted nucleic acid-binding protein